MGEYERLNKMLREEKVKLHNAEIDKADADVIADLKQGIGEIKGSLLEMASCDGLEDPYEAFDYFDYDTTLIECPCCERQYLMSITDEEREKVDEYLEKRFSSQGFVFQSIFPKRSIYEIQLLKYHFTGDSIINCCEKCEEERWG